MKTTRAPLRRWIGWRWRALVPQVWHVEVRSALLGAERGGRISPTDVDDCLRRVDGLPVQPDSEPDFDAAFALA